MPQDLPITAMFEELVAGKFITPTHHMEDMEFPGSLRRAPSVIGYATPDIPIRDGGMADAKLGKRTERNFHSSSD